MSESYARAYTALAQLQSLSEMEEVIRFRRLLVGWRSAAQAAVAAGEATAYFSNSDGGGGGIGDFASSSCFGGGWSGVVGPSPAAALRLLQHSWGARLGAMARDVDTHLGVLAVRSLAVPPSADRSAWVAFSDLCRDQGYPTVAAQVLANLGAPTAAEIAPPLPRFFGDRFAVAATVSLGASHSSGGALAAPSPGARVGLEARGGGAEPVVVYSALKLMWQLGGEPLRALRELELLVARLCVRRAAAGARPLPPLLQAALLGGAAPSLSSTAAAGGALGRGEAGSRSGREDGFSDGTRLLESALLRLGDWRQACVELRALDRSAALPPALAALRAATILQPRSHRAWQAWALLNYKMAERLHSGGDDQSGDRHPDEPHGSSSAAFAAAAVRAFFRAVDLQRSVGAAGVVGDGLQDVLRLLTLWFAHGHRSAEVHR